jgi:squalene-hopene/tetraprenyl-beta-curcumene cyclase
MNVVSRRFAPVLSLALILLASPTLQAQGPEPDWNKAGAGHYLDERAKEWFEFSAANRGQDATRISCSSCHMMISYAFGRPALRKVTGESQPTPFEVKLLANTKKRVGHWADLDTPKFALYYDFSEQKKKESWGTESVINALFLAMDDRAQARSAPSDEGRQAFANLWKTQLQTGENKGAWDWINFGLEPWESSNSRYFGASLAAIAVGTAPGYNGQKADVGNAEEKATQLKIDLLRGYLKGAFAKQSLFNQTWALWATTKLGNVLSEDDRKAVMTRLFDKQEADGGWVLATLGKYKRVDGTAQDTISDGYATGLVLHVLMTAGVPKEDDRIAKGLTWLRSNQAETGGWRTNSVNKKRNPETHVGKFMSDAATAFAILALSD